MLSLSEYPAEIGKPVYGDEMHGDERVPLVSVYMTIGLGALDLEEIKRGLCGSLFEKLDANDGRATIGPFARRFPSMNPVKFDDEYPGYRLTVHGDLIDTAQVWADVEIAKFEIDPKEGGGVSVKFRAQMRGSQLEPWVGLMHREVKVTLEPPKAEPLPEHHPDARADDGDQAQLPIGEGDAPADDPLRGTDLEGGAEGGVDPVVASSKGRKARGNSAHAD